MLKYLIISLLIVVAFILGLLLGGNGSMPDSQRESLDHAAPQQSEQIWTCSMHPRIRMSEPGQCPICGMDLIPVAIGEMEDLSERELKLSPTAVKLAEIQTIPVERKYVPVEIRMVGKIIYDETRLAHITARVPGRIDRLYVDYTGISVKKGDHMVYLYSPELLTAQEELLQALRAVGNLRQSNMKIMKEIALQTLEAARDKLRLWGLTDRQIANIGKREKPFDHITIYSPMGGIVIQKNVQEGTYVNTGMRLYTIADLSQLWVELNAYESDLVWLRYGQEVDIETEAYPGEVFKGTIAFINPVMDSRTRTVKVRVNVSNEKGRLKPEMFVHTTVYAQVAAVGKVMDEDLAGKWICPMHPAVIKDMANACDICGMPLVRTESLGYVSETDFKETEPPLVIPASATLITGERAVVYVAVPGKPGVYEGREIVLGPRAGDYYIVNQGLELGEQVVVNGNFKIDSALQIQAKPSMMNPEGGMTSTGHAHHYGMSMTRDGETGSEEPDDHEMAEADGKPTHTKAPVAFKQQIDGVLAAYYQIEEALSRNQAGMAQKKADHFLHVLKGVDMKLLTGPSHMIWMKELKDLKTKAGAMRNTSDIKKQREDFSILSDSMAFVVRTFGSSGKEPVIQFHCPMAFGGRGANWLQSEKDVQNPYFGKAMFKCGRITETLIEKKK